MLLASPRAPGAWSSSAAPRIARRPRRRRRRPPPRGCCDAARRAAAALGSARRRRRGRALVAGLLLNICRRDVTCRWERVCCACSCPPQPTPRSATPSEPPGARGVDVLFHAGGAAVETCDVRGWRPRRCWSSPVNPAQAASLETLPEPADDPALTRPGPPANRHADRQARGPSRARSSSAHPHRPPRGRPQAPPRVSQGDPAGAAEVLPLSRDGGAARGRGAGVNAERLRRRTHGHVDLRAAVGERDERRLELPGRQVDAPLQHRAEEPPEPLRVDAFVAGVSTVRLR